MKTLFSGNLLTAKSAADATGIAYLPQEATEQAQNITIHAAFAAASAAGTLLVEAAADLTYTGTWVTIATISWSAASKAHSAQIVGCFKALRVRISGAVTSGSLTVDAVVNG